MLWKGRDLGQPSIISLVACVARIIEIKTPSRTFISRKFYLSLLALDVNCDVFSVPVLFQVMSCLCLLMYGYDMRV